MSVEKTRTFAALRRPSENAPAHSLLTPTQRTRPAHSARRCDPRRAPCPSPPFCVPLQQTAPVRTASQHTCARPASEPLHCTRALHTAPANAARPVPRSPPHLRHFHRRQSHPHYSADPHHIPTRTRATGALAPAHKPRNPTQGEPPRTRHPPVSPAAAYPPPPIASPLPSSLLAPAPHPHPALPVVSAAPRMPPRL